MNSNAVVKMEDAVVARGQRAWSKIKTTAAEQRGLWRQIGDALAVGRWENKADQKFSQWCKDHGFGDMHRKVRANAIWLASVGRGVTPPNDLTHPTNIRDWFNEQLKDAAPTSPDTPVFTTKKSVEITSREASKAVKLITRSKSGDEGSVIAKRHLDSIVKKLETTVEELEEAVSNTVPEQYYALAPDHLQFAADVREGMLDHYNQLAAHFKVHNISEEAVASICLSVFLELKSKIKANQS